MLWLRHKTFSSTEVYFQQIAFEDDDKRAKAIRKWKFLNKYITIPLYKIGLLPLIGFGWEILLLKNVGRKSGREIITPLEYHRIDKVIHIFILRGEDSDTIKNMRANPDKVKVRHGFHKFDAEIEIIEEIDVKIEIMNWYIGKYKRFATMIMGVKLTDENRDEEMTKFAKQLSIVRLKKKE